VTPNVAVYSHFKEEQFGIFDFVYRYSICGCFGTYLLIVQMVGAVRTSSVDLVQTLRLRAIVFW
jgi:hypothetical protein